MESQEKTLETPQPERSENELGGVGPIAPVIDWTEEEEKRLVRKVDFLVMPALILGFAALQLDRGNIGFALTDFFFKDVGITQDQFNIGQQLLSAGIVLFELPSNLILYRLGPRIWVTGLIISWGLVSTFQAFQKGLASYLATRLLLGLTAGGYIPAGLYCINLWYKQSETSLRFSLFFMGNSFSQAASGLISFGVLHMRGVAGLAGWQWLFIFDGIFTILVGIAFAAIFPGAPSEGVSLLCIKYFTERERTILHQRILLDDPTKLKRRKNVSPREMLDAVANWRIYPHLVMALLGLAPGNALGSYSPTIVNNYGFGRLESNAFASIGRWVQLLLNPIWGYMADRTGRRGYVVLAGLTLWWTFTLTSRLLVFSNDRDAKFGVLSVALAVVAIWHPINGSWLSLNCRSAGERNVTMALYIMSSNLAGIIGGQIFREKDSPLYLAGWTVSVSLISVAVLCCLIAIAQYRILNMRIKRNSKLVDGAGPAYIMEAGEQRDIELVRLYQG
ncbi:major facilitator superfamily domain-containing protein [Ilyonectria sp. MPI-CAGE-AT-0026]|nr:major facilitator superfamily domain-containing protein [Ilyonectria sp. MPI-CAGE-AT-0026]